MIIIVMIMTVMIIMIVIVVVVIVKVMMMTLKGAIMIIKKINNFGRRSSSCFTFHNDYAGPTDLQATSQAPGLEEL